MPSEQILYDLHTLGWSSFQSLCATILREILGQTFETFADTDDAGRDGAFHGEWKRTGQEVMSGSFVMQCKFTARRNTSLQVSQVENEIEKVRRLAKEGLADNYILMTNASLRAPVEKDLRKRFLSISGVKHFEVFGGNWITEQIRHNKRLRTLVPRVYGLGDLTEILDERVYRQAKEILYRLGGELERFVVTDAHHRSVQALSEKGFVFLLGDPGSGKSTIAEALALAAADTWQSRVIKVDEVKDFSQHWNPDEPNQFFWVDDAFGPTQYERERAVSWNYALRSLGAAVQQGARAIFTSRTYIYKAAVRDLKESLFPLLKEGRVVIEVEKLTQKEREQILYNHLRLGGQPKKFRNTIKPFLEEVAAHKNFMPETARRLGDPVFTKKIKPTLDSILHFVEEPEEYLRDVIEKSGDDNRAALGLVFLRGGKFRAPIELTDEEQHALSAMNSTVGEAYKSLHSLEGSLIAKEIENGEVFFRFKHPTIRDALGGVLGEDANLMDVYLKGARPESLINEVTCGDMGLEGVKLIVPVSRFLLLISKLKELLEKVGGTSQIVSFLNSRCSAEFQDQFLATEPNFLSSIEFDPRYYLTSSKEVKFFGSLHTRKLLPEDQRVRLVNFICDTSVMRFTPEWSFAEDMNLRSVFKPSEFRSLRAKVRLKLTAKRLQGITDYYIDKWRKDGGSDPDDYFWSWEKELRAFANEFLGNEAAFTRFSTALKKLRKKKSQMKEEWAKKEGDLNAEKSVAETQTMRSLFDDVDE